MKTLKEYLNLVESNSFSNAMKKAIAAHERGDQKRARYHLENAKTARYSLKSTDVNKDPDLHKKYKELRDKYASTGGNFDIKHDMVGSAKATKDSVNENAYMSKIEGGRGEGKGFGDKDTTVDDHLSAMKYHSREYQKAMKAKEDALARHHGMKYHKHKEQIETLGNVGNYKKD